MSLDLKAAFLTCKHVISRPEHNEMKWWNENYIEMWIWKTPTDRAQKVDDKNETICPVAMSTFRVMVIKM